MRTRQLVMAATVLSLLASTAHAQAAGDPRDAEIQALRAQVQALAAKLDQLQARIEAPAAPPVIQTPAPAAAAPAAVVTLAAGKPSIASADGQFTANLHGVVHLDAADYEQAGAGPITTDLRRGCDGHVTRPRPVLRHRFPPGSHRHRRTRVRRLGLQHCL